MVGVEISERVHCALYISCRSHPAFSAVVVAAEAVLWAAPAAPEPAAVRALMACTILEVVMATAALLWAARAA